MSESARSLLALTWIAGQVSPSVDTPDEVDHRSSGAGQEGLPLEVATSSVGLEDMSEEMALLGRPGLRRPIPRGPPPAGLSRSLSLCRS